MLVCAWMVFPLSISGIWLLKYCILPEINQYRETCCATKPKRKHTNTEMKKDMNRVDLELVNVDHVVTNAKPSHFGACFTFLKTAKQWSTWSLKAEVRRRDTCPRTHRVALDWLFDRIIMDQKIPNQICSYQKPTRRHVDERQFHSWRMESSSPIIQHHDFFDLLLQPFQSK